MVAVSPAGLGKRAREQGQDVTFVTERCVIRLQEGRLVVTELAPWPDVQKDVLDQAATEIHVANDLRPMEGALFRPERMNLTLAAA